MSITMSTLPKIIDQRESYYLDHHPIPVDWPNQPGGVAEHETEPTKGSI